MKLLQHPVQGTRELSCAQTTATPCVSRARDLVDDGLGRRGSANGRARRERPASYWIKPNLALLADYVSTTMNAINRSVNVNDYRRDYSWNLSKTQR